MQIWFYTAHDKKTIATENLSKMIQSDQGAFWIDITGPTPEDINLMQDVFEFHPLAIEDISNQQQRPKVEEFSDHLFIIVNPVSVENDEVNSRELDIFVGTNYVITVHPEPDPVIAEASARIDPKRIPFSISATYLLYMLLDTVVDGYLPILEQIDHEIDELGSNLLKSPDPLMQAHLFRLKQSLNTLWWIVWPQRDILNTLTNHHLVFIDEKSQYYLRDITDHVLRITDLIQASRDSVTGLINLYVSAVSNQLNIAVNRLTTFTIILGIMAVIVGFYGMNFEQTWPAFDNPLGVPLVIIMMITAIVLALRYVRRT